MSNMKKSNWWGRRKHRKLVVTILEVTRDTFAATHWTSGTLYKIEDVPVYAGKGDDRHIVRYDTKKTFCTVGGFCNTMLEQAGVPQELRDRAEAHGLFYPKTLRDEHAAADQGYGGRWFTDIQKELALHDDVFFATIDAERCLAEAILRDQGYSVEEYAKDLANPNFVENNIVEWNDSNTTNKDAVIAMFNAAIAIAKKKKFA